MNNKTGLILRLILGGYLVFLGVSVIVQAVQTQPSDLVIKALFGGLFIVVGGVYAIVQIKKVYRMIKEETKDNSGAEAGNSTQFQKPQHDESLYRTAPMPSEEISKKIPAQATDLRANMSRMKAEEKKVQAEQKETKEEAEEKKPSRMEEKDPVNLAIEIMNDENEELEKDYEEK